MNSDEREKWRQECYKYERLFEITLYEFAKEYEYEHGLGGWTEPDRSHRISKRANVFREIMMKKFEEQENG